MRRSWLFVLLPLALAACNSQTTHQAGTPPSVYVAPATTEVPAATAGTNKKFTALSLQSLSTGGSPVRTFQANVNATVVTHVNGMPDQVSNSPAGLQAAYLIQGGNIKTRIDYPAADFGDNRARIVTFDKNSGAAKILFADTLLADPSVSPTDINSLLQSQQNFAAQQIDSANPFVRKAANNWQQTAVAAGGTAGPTGITAQGYGTAQVSKSFSLSTGDTQQSVLTYDEGAGGVVRIQSTIDNATTTQNSNSNISYVAVTDLQNVNLPYQIDTTQTINLKTTGQTANINQTVNYDNIRINTLSDSFFQVGGN